MDTPTTTNNHRGQRPTRIAVELRDGRARACTLDQGYFLGGRIMQITGSHIRVALVGIHMPLLGGDKVAIEVTVGPGVTLEVIEPSGMVAYDAEGEYSSWRLNAEVAENATLVWQGAAFVAAKGSHAHRNSKIELAHGARALFREMLVLGRSGESNVCLNNRLQVSLDGQELLVEELNLSPATRKLPGIVGSSKAVSTVTALGMRPSDEIAGSNRLNLAGPGAVWRSLAPAAHSAEKITAPVYKCWRREILKRSTADKVAGHTSQPVPADSSLQL